MEKIIRDKHSLNQSPMDWQSAVKLIQFFIHAENKRAGWYTDIKTGEPLDRNVAEMIALMHSELSESLEAYRKNQNDDKLPHRKGIEVEFADTIIRIFDCAGYLNLDIAGAISEKLDYNVNRADHRIENRRKEGGKKI